MSYRNLICVSGLTLLWFAACRQDMSNQPKAKPYSGTEFFNDGTSARPLPLHSVPHGEGRADDAFYTGLTNNTLVAQLPMQLTPELFSRGRERFDIHCAICHGLTGDGRGQVVERGFPAPPSLHLERLRNAPIGHFYDVISNGYGVMYPYASRVEPNDRWAIAAYIRALQLSQNAKVSGFPPNERQQLERKP